MALLFKKAGGSGSTLAKCPRSANFLAANDLEDHPENGEAIEAQVLCPG